MSGPQTQAGGRAWVTGAGGLIGHYLARAASEHATQFEVIALTRSDLDVTDFAAVERRFRADRPQLIVHCAAMSKSPDCQANPALARTVNVDATAHLAALAREIGFIFFSTDLVFDGTNGNYIETDGVNPLSVYGETKVAAERIVLENPRHIVVRTSLNSGSSPKGNTAYNEQLRDGWMRGKTIQLFFDEFRSPIPAAVTARATWELAALAPGGMYHLAGSQRLSRAQIGQLAAERHPELQARMERCSLREYVGAPRPADTSLNCARIQQRLTFPLPGLTQWLREHPEDVF
ncbi:MAG TPA: SDR family oxidoreductase [Candidatus Saccharimonadales bacterium]|nr:SDR family oxidoreductase [Candidatus Saccharimonadales bacterium]